MPQVVVGTAGHIDHGKTSLVRALTGTDTDGLLEEKERGMTIDLGFAYLNKTITIIDVPGHEKFIRNMAAGAANIHFGLLVVAADDGVMPQTREHLDILTLLGVNKGLVAITKTDLIKDSDWLDLVELDLEDLLNSRGFNATSINRVNNITGEGIDALKSNILLLADSHSSESSSINFRMNIDRVFSKTGFGTVTTGTVINGTAKVGDKVELLPEGTIVKIRGIQSHGEVSKKVELGDRAALNITHSKGSNIYRGSVLCSPKTIEPSYRLIAYIQMTETTEWVIKNKQRLRFHFGTSEILGRVTLSSENTLKKAESGNLIIDLESNIAVAMDDRFVIRSYSPMNTIAGGIILEAAPKGEWKFIRDHAKKIPTETRDRFIYLVNKYWRQPKFKEEWETLFFNYSELIDEWKESLNFLTSEKGVLYSGENQERAIKELCSFFKDNYKSNPFRSVINTETIKAALYWSEDWLYIVLKVMLDNKLIKEEKGGYLLIGHLPKYTQSDIDEVEEIEKVIKRSGIEPILFREINELCVQNPKKVGDLLHVLTEQKKIEGLGSNFYLHTYYLDSLIIDIRNYFDSNNALTVSDFKNITNLSRKTAIPLLEYLDKNEYTFREGNDRIKGKALNG
tara:strand:- start:3584 stop:5458 length:1875 start_codon:yes stop_codon:yes gene_type:complete